MNINKNIDFSKWNDAGSDILYSHLAKFDTYNVFQYTYELDYTKLLEKELDEFLRSLANFTILSYVLTVNQKLLPRYYLESKDLKTLVELKLGQEDSNYLHLNIFTSQGLTSFSKENEFSKFFDKYKKNPKIKFYSVTKSGCSSTAQKETKELIKQLDPNHFIENYPVGLRKDITHLLEMKKFANKGKLIILNGPPGCGKSHLVRNLITHWSHWCDIYYITDSETFCNNSNYMNEVLKLSHNKPSVYILEDVDNYISTDCKISNNSGISRLLNLMDGLLGDSLNAMFILTANEKGHKIHEAFRRKGRCYKYLEFSKLTQTEATEWLKLRNKEDLELPKVSKENSSMGFSAKENTGTITLADLYALIDEE